jgi:transposase
MNTTMSFTSHHIYVGLDISKPSWEVCILTEHVEHKTLTQPPSVKALVQYLKRNFPAATYHCVYEAGRFGFWIHDQLILEGIECLIVNSADVPTTNKETTHKNDRIDARKLARSLRSGDPKSIYIP